MDYSSETSDLLSATYTCSGSPGGAFSHEFGNCENVNKTLRFVSTFESTTPTLTCSNSMSLTIQAGYNLFTTTNFPSAIQNLQLFPGTLLSFQLTAAGGKIAVDSSGIATVSDYSEAVNGGVYSRLNTLKNWRLYARAIVSPFTKSASVFKSYLTAGTYTVTAVLGNILLTGNSQTLTQTVNVQAAPVNITGLSFTTVYGSSICYMNVNCGFLPTTLTGNYITYTWTINSTTTTTNQTTFSNQFSSTGTYVVNLMASNSISSQSVTVSITVVNQMTGLSFKSGTSTNSSSIVGQTANFLFILLVGTNYNCLINYGDGLSASISDSVSYINNTYIPHTYPNNEYTYIVKINCTNPINSLVLVFNHFVQYQLANLVLTSYGTTINTAYNIGFSFTGSIPYQLNCYFDNLPNSCSLYTNVLGKDATHNGEATPIIHYVFINMTNYVSSIQLNTTFQISSPLVGPKFAVIPTSGISGYTYLYPTSLTFSVTVQSGSNVNISISTDSLNQISTLLNNSINIQTVGQWLTNPYNIPYVYANPGGFTILATISNAFNSFSFTQYVKIISKVDDLIPNLITYDNNVIFNGMAGNGLAQFVFTYFGNTKAGSDAYVTFWPGDTSNSTNGPFLLNMDFNKNVSRAPLQYTYTSQGNYTAVFYVSNPLGSKYFTLTFKVIYSLAGFYVGVNPTYCQVGNSVLVSAYLFQGNGITYAWLADNTTFSATSSRICKLKFKNN